MKAIGTKVQVNDDLTLTIQLPADVQSGEYDVVVVLNPRLTNAESREGQEPSHSEDEQDKTMAERWKKWFEEVDKLPLPENPGEGDFQQHLIEKYRKQGLDL